MNVDVELNGVGEFDQSDVVVVVRGVVAWMDVDSGAGNDDLGWFYFPYVVGPQDDLDVGFSENQHNSK